ncbi:hypothetical protein J2W27_002099 [Variovorax boronicumulans]|uniref:hypothetical protein n=1 Tax=Variovorax boronicumulans TaxID=436515 RepID=UPI00278B839F|nr:hypothetical protein [Variovorax boronicumulans]MDP9909987.1 hypothetical protein [Variovorax boronicumulans]
MLFSPERAGGQSSTGWVRATHSRGEKGRQDWLGELICEGFLQIDANDIASQYQGAQLAAFNQKVSPAPLPARN